MSIASFLYGDFDAQEMLESASSNIIRVTFKIIDDCEELNDVLSALCKQRAALASYLEDETGDVQVATFSGDVAERLFRENFYVKEMRKQMPTYCKNSTDDDIMEGVTTWDVVWEDVSLTAVELQQIASCIVGKWKAVHSQLVRMNKEMDCVSST